MKHGLQTVARIVRLGQLLSSLIVAFLVVACSGIDTRINIPDSWSEYWPDLLTDDDDGLSKEEIERLNAESDFSVARQIKNQYLVLEVVVTENDITIGDPHLVRGPDKANSAFGHIEIRALSGGKVVMSYTTQNPRLTKVEGEPWGIADAGGMVIFVLLDAAIDSVEIRPVPGQQYTISRLVRFNPLSKAQDACEDSPSGFPACDQINARPRPEFSLTVWDDLQ